MTKIYRRKCKEIYDVVFDVILNHLHRVDGTEKYVTKL